MALLIPGLLVGRVMYLEVFHVFEKVNCHVPVKYTPREVLENVSDGWKWFKSERPIMIQHGMSLHRNIYTDKDEKTQTLVLLNIYKLECLETYLNLFNLSGRSDMNLKSRAKTMAAKD